jgi:hypothetical protein
MQAFKAKYDHGIKCNPQNYASHSKKYVKPINALNLHAISD